MSVVSCVGFIESERHGPIRKCLTFGNEELNRDETFPVQRIEVDFPRTQPISLIPIHREEAESVNNYVHGRMVVAEGLSSAIRLCILGVPKSRRLLAWWMRLAYHCGFEEERSEQIVEWAKQNKHRIAELMK